ncbi:MAG: hypothetical protein IJ930_09160 [Lachnospiraceae bacterium]|nr:hypothetical protein [Lachnospiraceae bacterium]
MYILIPLCLCFLAACLYNEKQKKHVRATVFKGLASLSFVTLGLLCSPGGKTASLVTAGLILGMIADILLNLRFVFKEKAQSVFLAGILVFLSGHILYLAAVFPLIRHRLTAVIAGAAVTAVLIGWLFGRITAKKSFRIFGIIYIGAIMILNVTALFNIIEHPAAFSMIFAAGTFLFLISDVVLILNTFGPQTRFGLRVTNTVLYYVGQLLIALSLLKL